MSSRMANRLLTALRKLPAFSRRRQTSLLSRLMGLAYIWGLLIVLVAFLGVWWSSSFVIKDNVRRLALQWVGKFDELGTPLLVSGDPLLFQPIKEHLKNFPEIPLLRYYDAGGKTVLAEYRAGRLKPGTIPALDDRQISILKELGSDEKPRLVDDYQDANLLRVTTPVWVKSMQTVDLLDFSLEAGSEEKTSVIGFIDVALDYRLYKQDLGKNVTYGGLIVLLLLVVTTVIGRFTISRALRPLAALQIPLAKLARGDTDIEVQSQGDIEIAAIGDALNTTIAALKQRDAELIRLATFDNLTGLLNRHSFTRELEREKARCVLEEHSSALLFIDLDKFKDVNDTVGHAAGDELLRQVAKLLKGKVRSNDIVARLGGDEFTIILRHVTEYQAIQIATQVGDAMREFYFSSAGQSFNIHCSIGVTIIDNRPYSPEVLLSQADTACHEAKKHGRDCFKLFSEVSPEEVLNLEGGLRDQIERALNNNGFSLVFLPIHRLAGNRIVGFEGLVRMQAGDQLVPAVAFLSAAERLDLAPRIDQWVISHALEQFACVQDQTLTLSINLSGRSLQHPEMLEYIEELLSRYPVDPGRIIFEIPERSILDSVTQSKNFMQKLRDFGCQVAIDDFGVSLNSINLLRSLPVNQLKIEATLINGVCTSGFNQAVVRSLGEIAKELNIASVAKQVDRQETMDCLKDLPINLIQGHWVGKPRNSLTSTED